MATAVEPVGPDDGPLTSPPGSTARRALLIFTAAATVLSLVLAAATVVGVQRADQRQALGRAEGLAGTRAHDVVGPAFVRAAPSSKAVLDQLLGSRARDGSVVRIKLWSPDGEVLWADDARLIGKRYQLAPEDQALVGTRDAYAELTDLSKPENEFETSLAGSFIEVYAGFFDRAGHPLVFEAYLPVGELGGGLLRRDLLGLALGCLALLLLVMLPLTASLAARVDRAQAQQQRLLRHAVDASQLERKRLAQDLHDGVIQDLAGVGYVFSALEAQLAEHPAARATAARAAGIVRRDVLALRALSTDLYPPDLGGEGLEAALVEMLGQCEQEGLGTDLAVSDRLDLPPTTALVAYRVVREALRNVVKHARASTVLVAVEQSASDLLVRVADDGVGFDATAGPPAGHLGLRILRDAATDVGGTVAMCSEPGRGSRLEVRLPLR